MKKLAPWYFFAGSFFIGAVAILPAYFYTQWEIPIIFIGLFLAGVLPIVKREKKYWNFLFGVALGINGMVIAKVTESLWAKLIN